MASQENGDDESRHGLISLHQSPHKIHIFQSRSFGALILIRGSGVASIDVLVVEKRLTRFLEELRHLAGVSRMNPVVLGGG